jgi:hypothetical protein
MGWESNVCFCSLVKFIIREGEVYKGIYQTSSFLRFQKCLIF